VSSIRLLLRLKWLIVSLSVLGAGTSAAQEVELKHKFGIWSVYCSKETVQPSYSSCSITSGVQAKDNADIWTKVAVAIASPTGELEMTVRTPVLKYLRKGISLGFDGRQAVKGIVDSCTASACESTISLDALLINQIGTADRMSIEYPVGEEKGVLLTFDLEQIVPALDAMEKYAGLRSDAIASAEGIRVSKSPIRLVLERRRFEQIAMSDVAWKAPLEKCSAAPTTKVVFVNNDLTVQNEKDVRDWVEKSSKCSSEAVAWIKEEPTGAETTGASLDPVRLGSLTLYNYVSKIMPTGVVPGDNARVPIFPQFTPENLHAGAHGR
jgi:invasion protein IalB